uniref:Uncharacterized protein n=1 Tax=Insect mononegavirales virus 2 TaxID=2819082 RepID=A0A7G9IRA7_9MONO|nr:hypothetical protein [Insect mononegavirales virus 2]
MKKTTELTLIANYYLVHNCHDSNSMEFRKSQASQEVKARLSKAVEMISNDRGVVEEEDADLDTRDFEELPGAVGSWSRTIGTARPQTVKKTLDVEEWVCKEPGSLENYQVQHLLETIKRKCQLDFSFTITESTVRVIFGEKEETQQSQPKAAVVVPAISPPVAPEAINHPTPAAEIPVAQPEQRTSAPPPPVDAAEPESSENEEGTAEDLVLMLAEGVKFVKKRGGGVMILKPTAKEQERLIEILSEYRVLSLDLGVEEMLKLKGCKQRMMSLYDIQY